MVHTSYASNDSPPPAHTERVTLRWKAGLVPVFLHDLRELFANREYRLPAEDERFVEPAGVDALRVTVTEIANQRIVSVFVPRHAIVLTGSVAGFALDTLALIEHDVAVLGIDAEGTRGACMHA